MTNILLIIIVVFEVIRLWAYLIETRRVHTLNNSAFEQQKKVLEFAKQQEEDWKRIRKAEIEELRLLAKESDTMKEIYDEWKTAHTED